MSDIPIQEITGLVLAGGQARRMGGGDKGLVPLSGKAMIAHVLERFRPQVAQLWINANRNRTTYESFGFPVVADRYAGYSGPLAGMDAGLARTPTRFLATVPCDSPGLPRDLVRRLHTALTQADADMAVAHDGERTHPVFALLDVRLAGSLASALAEGERKIDRWYARHRVAYADFSEQPQAFANVNTPEDQARFSQTWDARGARE